MKVKLWQLGRRKLAQSAKDGQQNTMHNTLRFTQFAEKQTSNTNVTNLLMTYDLLVYFYIMSKYFPINWIQEDRMSTNGRQSNLSNGLHTYDNINWWPITKRSQLLLLGLLPLEQLLHANGHLMRGSTTNAMLQDIAVVGLSVLQIGPSRNCIREQRFAAIVV